MNEEAICRRAFVIYQCGHGAEALKLREFRCPGVRTNRNGEVNLRVSKLLCRNYQR